MTVDPLKPTDPRIAVAQETSNSIRLLSAMRRLYSDGKAVHYGRLALVTGGGALGVVAALVWPNARPLIGLSVGGAALLLSIFGSAREKRLNHEAAAVQEEFDITIFGLPWNPLLANRPSTTTVSGAARRYRGVSLSQWYPDTGAVARPLDILICQRSSVGWGVSLHRLWAAILTSALVVLGVAAVALAWALGLRIDQALLAIGLPLLAPASEAISLIRGNVESARAKADLEQKIDQAWRRGLEDPQSVTESDCRAIQDRILGFRQISATVPDWLAGLRHASREEVMRDSANHLIAQAEDHGAA